jgi:hypothetical protein
VTEKTEPDVASTVAWLLILFLTISHELLVAVVAEHAWERWAVAAGAPPIPFVAVVVALMLRVALRWRGGKRTDLSDADLSWSLSSAVAQYLWLAATAAVVWGAP